MDLQSRGKGGGPSAPRRHLELGGGLYKVEEPLVVYRHVGGSLCSSTPRKLLLEIRLRAFERR